jgi:vacuolar protein sorting-associated protein 35
VSIFSLDSLNADEFPILSQVAPKFIVSLVELITTSIDLTLVFASPDMMQRHFRNMLKYILSKKTSENPGRYDEVGSLGRF